MLFSYLEILEPLLNFQLGTHMYKRHINVKYMLVLGHVKAYIIKNRLGTCIKVRQNVNVHHYLEGENTRVGRVEMDNFAAQKFLKW